MILYGIFNYIPIISAKSSGYNCKPHPPSFSLSSYNSVIQKNSTKLISNAYNTTNIINSSSINSTSTSSLSKAGINLPIIKDLGFEIGQPNKGWEWGSANYQDYPNNSTNRLSTVSKNNIPNEPSSPDTNGEKALKVYVESPDCINNGSRAEVFLTSLNLTEQKTPGFNPSDFLMGNDTWFHWYVLFPKDLQVPNTWHIVTQWHGEEYNFLDTCYYSNGTAFGCSIVPIVFNLRTFDPNQTSGNPDRKNGTVLELQVLNSSDANNGGHYSTSDVPWTTWNYTTKQTSFKFGHWYDFLFHIKWEPCTTYILQNSAYKCQDNQQCNPINANTGFIEMWLDGKKVIDKTSHETLARVFDPNGPIHNGQIDPVFFVQGLYHCTSDPNGNNCAAHNPPLPTPNPQTIYYDGTLVALCDNPDSKNYHPPLPNKTGLGECKTGSPYP